MDLNKERKKHMNPYTRNTFSEDPMKSRNEQQFHLYNYKYISQSGDKLQKEHGMTTISENQRLSDMKRDGRKSRLQRPPPQTRPDIQEIRQIEKRIP